MSCQTVVLSRHRQPETRSHMWQHLYHHLGHHLLKKTLHNSLHVALSASPNGHPEERIELDFEDDIADDMGKGASKEEGTEIDNSFFRLDLLHLPTALTGSTVALIIIVMALFLCICCCRPSLTKFCFRKVFKDAHHHLPVYHPPHPPYEPLHGPAYDQNIQPVYPLAGPAQPVRQAPPPPNVVRMEAAPAFPQQQRYSAMQPIRQAITYQQSANTIDAASRIQEVNEDPAAYL